MGWRAEVLVDETTMAQGLIRDARDGLGGRPKRLPPKYFYDAAGSALFERITQLPEYYLTRAERALLAAHGGEIMADLTPQELVELGAGSVSKVRSLLRAAPVGASVLRYVPLDIDAGTIAAAGRELDLEYPDLDVHGIVGDFQQHLGHVPGSVGRRLVAFFGSTIGNLDPEPRRQLLDGVRGLLSAEDRFLLGLDLVKERRVLEAAYDDRAGVTAAFNRNILRVVNRGLGGNFVPEAFRHLARYDADASRIEMHLVPARRQSAYLRDVDLTVEVAAGESIWTESSYKFTRETVEAMLTASGLGLDRWYSDAQFALALAAPRG